MAPTCITTIDPRDNEPLPVVEPSNVVWTSGAVWDGFVVERHKFDAVDMPEFVIRNYSVIIQISPSISIESKIKGLFQGRVSRPGNICIFSAGAPRQVRTRQPLEVIVITLPRDVLRAGYDSRVVSTPELIEYHDLHDQQIQHIGLALKEEAESGFLSGSIYGESLALALSCRLLARYSAAPSQPAEQKGGLSPCSLRRVTEYIHENLSADLRLADLAKTAGLSPYRFSHNFKQSTGLAPHQFVTRERIEESKRMLRETDLSITTIAFAVGSGSPSRFASLFRNMTGQTPSEYRASFKKA
jgi:AraC family transcriptional regulator